MATSYTTILKLALPATGELAGTWGDVVNQNITSMIEEAIAGLAVINTWAGASHTLTTANGTTSESRAAVLDLSGSPGGAATVICPDETKIYVVRNGVTGGFTATIKTSAGTGITIPNGRTAFVFCDGTNVELAADFMDVAEITTLTSTTGNITTVNATTVNATTVDTTNIEVTNLKAKDGTSAGSIADSTGVVTLASSVLTTTDINGGSIDGTTIGGSTAAAGTFSSLTTTTADINGGSIDGTTIGGSTPAAGTFTALTANGNVILGDAATDTVTVTADVASDLIPSVDGSFDLGASGAEWQDLFIDGTANIDSLVADTADINGGTIDGTAIGANTASTGDFTNLEYTGTLTGSTGVINIGSGQVYKDASGNVGIGTSSPAFRLSTRINSLGNLAEFRSIDGGQNPGLVVSTANNVVNMGTTTSTSFPDIAFTLNTERMRITSAGNVGIGTTDPINKLDVNGNLTVRGGGGEGGEINLLNATGSATATFIDVDGLNQLRLYNSQNTATIFATNNAEAGRFDSSGNLLVGTTSANPGIGNTITGAAINGNLGIGYFSRASDASLIMNTNADSSVSLICRSGSVVGSISVTTTSTSYNTSSDYRLKTFIAPVTGSGARIDALEPVEFEWLVDGKPARGFFAHQFQEVYPDSVTGEKDEVDKDGNPVHQAMQAGSSEVIADLVAEIQSLRARVAQLEGN